MNPRKVQVESAMTLPTEQICFILRIAGVVLHICSTNFNFSKFSKFECRDIRKNSKKVQKYHTKQEIKIKLRPIKEKSQGFFPGASL